MEEDYKSRKKAIKIICLIIILLIIIITIFILYINNSNKENTNNFYTYLEENNYKKDSEGIYTKKTTNGNITTTERAISNKYLFEKSISENDTNYTSINLFYTNDKTIEIMYQVEGYDLDNNYGVLYQKGTYKNGDFKCEIVTNQNFQTQCTKMKEEAQKYEKKINQIISKYKIDPTKINMSK